MRGFEENIRLNAEKCLEIIKVKNINNFIQGKETLEEKLTDKFIRKNYSKIWNTLGNEIIDYCKVKFQLDEVFKEIVEKSINDDEEIIKELENIFERDVFDIEFETEKEFLNMFYENFEKDFGENINIEEIENTFYEKISFIKEDIILDLIENKIFKEYQKWATKEENKNI